MRWALCALALLGCAHASPGGPKRIEITEPTVITAGPPELAPLTALDDQTLFDQGTRAFNAGDFERAAQDFDALWQSHPGSPQRLPALFNASLSYERMAKYREALDRSEKYLKEKDEPEGQFHAAFQEYQLHSLDAAAARLKLLATKLQGVQKANALTQEAVCRIEGNARSDGELLLRQALELYEKADEPVDPTLPAQAEFWLGEAYRATYRETALDPSRMDETTLSAALETKAEFLLSAQGHYLRSIRKGDGEWATAAGYRIGEMYESLYDELVHAPEPRGLTDEQRKLYAEELHKKAGNLIQKAVRIYEQTLSTAQDSGASNAYRQKTQDALERLRKLLL